MGLHWLGGMLVKDLIEKLLDICYDQGVTTDKVEVLFRYDEDSDVETIADAYEDIWVGNRLSSIMLISKLDEEEE